MPGETHSYHLTLKFLETYSDQNSNQGKTFTGKIQVTTGDDTTNEYYYNSANPSGTTEEPSSNS